MGVIKVHEFIILDGVIDDPKWSFACESYTSGVLHLTYRPA